MSLLPILVLAAFQSAFEYFPVSSSAHLLIAAELMGLSESLLIDVTLHLGTLIAVIIYFRRETCDFIRYLLTPINNQNSNNKEFNNGLVIASVPIVLVGGIAFATGYADILRNLQVIGLSTIIFGLLLYFADIKKNTLDSKLNKLTFKKSLIIGIFQCFAIIPGASRSGVVYSGARLLGLNRTDSLKFSMILSIPVIAISSTIPLFEIYKNPIDIEYSYLLLGFVVSFLIAYLSIGILLKWVERFTMKPFVIYRIILGSVILIYFV